MFLIVLLSVLVLVLLIAVLSSAMRGAKRYSWAEYYLRTREAGMGMAEARQLRDAASLAGLADPTNILWSPRDMDKAIAVLGATLKREGKDRSREGVLLMDKVYALRKRIEFEQPRHKYGIRSCRHIGAGQRAPRPASTASASSTRP